jgi:hypothetical protein
VNLERKPARNAYEPATRTQVGAIRGEFRRLGYDEDKERAARLTACAVLLRVAHLDTTNDLTMAQAGWLIRTLRQIRDHDELAAIISDESQAMQSDHELDGPTLIDALAQAMGIVVALLEDSRSRHGDQPGDAPGD